MQGAGSPPWGAGAWPASLPALAQESLAGAPRPERPPPRCPAARTPTSRWLILGSVRESPESRFHQDLRLPEEPGLLGASSCSSDRHQGYGTQEGRPGRPSSGAQDPVCGHVQAEPSSGGEVALGLMLPKVGGGGAKSYKNLSFSTASPRPPAGPSRVAAGMLPSPSPGTTHACTCAGPRCTQELKVGPHMHTCAIPTAPWPAEGRVQGRGRGVRRGSEWTWL